MRRKVVLYLRLSSFTEESTSIARQESDLTALAEREDWEIVRRLADDNTSGRKARAKAAEALQMLRDGEADVLAVWKLDRWTRQGLSAVGDLVDTLDAAPGSLFVALQDGLRSDQSSWRLIAAVLSEVARTEADNTKLRVKSSIASLRTSGRWPGGIVPFGYWPAPNPEGAGRILRPHPPEAAVIREVATRIVGGEPLTRITSDLNRRRVATSKSAYRMAEIAGRDPVGADRGVWRLSSLKQVWSANFLLGRVTHAGAVVTNDDGLPAQVFEPILDLATMTLIRNRIGTPGGGSPAAPRKTRAARLLSGVAYCGHCDKRLYVGTINGKPSYRCPDPGAPGTGPSVRVMAEPLEAHISAAFLSLVGHWPESVETEVVTDPGSASDLAEVEAALREMGTAFTADDADIPALTRRREQLVERRSALRSMPATVSRVRTLTGRTRGEAWHATETVDERREVLLGVIDHIQVAAAVTRGSAFDPARVAVRWADEDLDALTPERD